MDNKGDKYFINEFLSNERTFLSWIRTAVGILVFGFVTVKFSLFLKHIPTKNIQEIPIHVSDYTVYMGFGFLIAGALIMLLAYLRYIQTIKLLKKGEYKYSSLLITIFSVILFIMVISLISYLIASNY